MTEVSHKDYIIAVQAPAYRLRDGSFATESAFVIHLKELRASLGARFRRVILIAPELTQAEYLERKPQLDVLSPERDEVVYVPSHSTSTSARSFWFGELPKFWRRLAEVLPDSAVVHSGMADDIKRPSMAVVNIAAWLRRKPVIFIVDIDFREDTRRYYKLGLWSRKRYWAHRLVYDPIKWIQVWCAPRIFQLVLLKSASMVRDFGKGRSHVKNFYDTVHSDSDLLPKAEQPAHFEWLSRPGEPLRVVYFGRFVEYKGLSRAIEAVRLARSEGEDIRLTLIGDGDCRNALEHQVKEAGLVDHVTFCAPVRYGPALFELLASAHLTIATPVVEDTPRAAFDSMARGLPILAFDINYFRDLAQDSGAVALASWPDPKALAARLGALSRDRGMLVAMARSGLDFAAANTQATWLVRRAAWTDRIVNF